MMAKFIAAQSPVEKGIVLVRIIAGLIIASFGLEVFDQEMITGYSKWLKDLHFPVPRFMAYLGKLSELVGGVFLAVGFLTRIASLILVITMFVITFIMSDGNLRSDSFILLLLFLTFFFIGSGKWSLDYVFMLKKNQITALHENSSK